MQLQVAPADPDGPRAPLRSKFYDPDGWDSTGSPADSISFSPACLRTWFCMSASHQVLREDLPETQRFSGRLPMLRRCTLRGTSFSCSRHEDTNDEAGPCGPSELKLSAVSAGLCGTKLRPGEARAPSDMHDRVLVYSVGGTRTHPDVCDRLAVSFAVGGAREHAVATGLFC